MLEYFFDNNVSDLWNSGKTSEAQEISFLLPAEKLLLELIASESGLSSTSHPLMSAKRN